MAAPMEESRFTVRREGRFEQTINKSRFIGIAAPVGSETEARAKIAAVHAEFPDASSMCWGYACGASGQLQRFYDDHEPVGGKPILDAILKRGLVGCVCVVVRYFGGIKLGAGGLARAFGSTAIAAVDDAQPGTAERSYVYSLTYDYSLQGKIEYYLEHSEHRAGKTEFGMDVTTTVLVRGSARTAFEARIDDMSGGSALYEIVEETFTFWED